MTLDLIDAVGLYPGTFSRWRDPLPGEVELCQDWLTENSAEADSWSGCTAGSIKGEMDCYVRTGSFMAALVMSEDWPVESDGRQIVVC